MLHVSDSEIFYVGYPLLNNLEFGYIWECQGCFKENLFLHEVKQRLDDWFNEEAQSFLKVLQCMGSYVKA